MRIMEFLKTRQCSLTTIWFLLPNPNNYSLSDNKKFEKLTKKELFFKGTIIALIVTIPSIIAFVASWILLDDLMQAAIIGAVVHFLAMGFSLKISKKFLVKT